MRFNRDTAWRDRLEHFLERNHRRVFLWTSTPRPDRVRRRVLRGVTVVYQPAIGRDQGLRCHWRSRRIPPKAGGITHAVSDSEQAEHPGSRHRVLTIACGELGEDVLQVPLDGLGAQVESARNFLVAHALRQVREH